MGYSTEESLSLRVDNYIQDLFTPQDEVLQRALEEMVQNGLPSINVSPNEGKLLYLLTKISGAKKILEIGTLAAYSTIWLARALPDDGKIITLEYENKHAEIARQNIERAGLSGKIEVRVGAALDLLPEIEAKGEGPFDLFFIDADKENNPAYLEWAIKLSRPGSLILSDNLIRDGAVLDPDPNDKKIMAVAKYNRELATNPRLESLILPLIREISDGIGITIVKD